MKANEIIEAIKNGDEALYRSEKDRTIGIISERVRNKQSITDQRGWLDAISYAYWSYLAPGLLLGLSRWSAPAMQPGLLQRRSRRAISRQSQSTIDLRSTYQQWSMFKAGRGFRLAIIFKEVVRCTRRSLWLRSPWWGLSQGLSLEF